MAKNKDKYSKLSIDDKVKLLKKNGSLWVKEAGKEKSDDALLSEHNRVDLELRASLEQSRKELKERLNRHSSKNTSGKTKAGKAYSEAIDIAKTEIKNIDSALKEESPVKFDPDSVNKQSVDKTQVEKNDNSKPNKADKKKPQDRDYGTEIDSMFKKAESMLNGKLKKNLIKKQEDLFNEWNKKDPDGAKKWIKKHELNSDVDALKPGDVGYSEQPGDIGIEKDSGGTEKTEDSSNTAMSEGEQPTDKAEDKKQKAVIVEGEGEPPVDKANLKKPENPPKTKTQLHTEALKEEAENTKAKNDLFDIKLDASVKTASASAGLPPDEFVAQEVNYKGKKVTMGQIISQNILQSIALISAPDGAIVDSSPMDIAMQKSMTGDDDKLRSKKDLEQYKANLRNDSARRRNEMGMERDAQKNKVKFDSYIAKQKVRYNIDVAKMGRKLENSIKLVEARNKDSVQRAEAVERVKMEGKREMAHLKATYRLEVLREKQSYADQKEYRELQIEQTKIAKEATPGADKITQKTLMSTRQPYLVSRLAGMINAYRKAPKQYHKAMSDNDEAISNYQANIGNMLVSGLGKRPMLSSELEDVSRAKPGERGDVEQSFEGARNPFAMANRSTTFSNIDSLTGKILENIDLPNGKIDLGYYNFYSDVDKSLKTGINKLWNSKGEDKSWFGFEDNKEYEVTDKDRNDLRNAISSTLNNFNLGEDRKNAIINTFIDSVVAGKSRDDATEVVMRSLIKEPINLLEYKPTIHHYVTLPKDTNIDRSVIYSIFTGAMENLVSASDRDAKSRADQMKQVRIYQNTYGG